MFKPKNLDNPNKVCYNLKLIGGKFLERVEELVGTIIPGVLFENLKVYLCLKHFKLVK